MGSDSTFSGFVPGPPSLLEQQTDHVRGVQPVRGQSIRLEADPHSNIAITNHCHVRDAGHARQPILAHDGRKSGQKLPANVGVCRGHAED
jgi:hypothetical protein